MSHPKIEHVKNIGDSIFSDEVGSHELDFDLSMVDNGKKIKVIGYAIIDIKAEGDFFVQNVNVMADNLFLFNEERKIGMFNTNITYALLDELVENHCIV